MAIITRQHHHLETTLLQTPNGLRGLGLYHGRTIVLPGSGHAPFFDSPTEFDELLNGFVGAVEYGCATDELALQYRQAFAV